MVATRSGWKSQRVFGFLFDWLVGFLVIEIAPRLSHLGDSFRKHKCLPPDQGALLSPCKVQEAEIPFDVAFIDLPSKLH